MNRSLFSRRDILAGMGAATGAVFLRPIKVLARASADITFGYASISWNGKDQQAIDDIASLGFKGIQLRSNIMPEWGDKPGALRDLLKERRLTFVALSSGNILIDPAKEAEDQAAHARNAKFVKDAGGLYLQAVSYTHLRAHETPEHL